MNGSTSSGRTPPKSNNRRSTAEIVHVQLSPDDLMSQPFHRRQFIVVRDDEAIAELRRAETATDTPAWGLDDPVKAAVTFGAVGVGVVKAREQIQARRLARSAPLPVLAITDEQAAPFTFSPGRPVHEIVYVADPHAEGRYHPIDSFHRYMFDAKLDEAMHLLQSLGATEITVDYIKGYNHGLGIDFSATPPAQAQAAGTAGARLDSKVRSKAKLWQKFPPRPTAEVPSNLMWFSSEPHWQGLARARLNHGLQQMTMQVEYTDEFGVNADLKMKIDRVGLKGSGKFTDFEETLWNVQATFGPLGTAPLR
jgi:hypothetical protein